MICSPGPNEACVRSRFRPLRAFSDRGGSDQAVDHGRRLRVLFWGTPAYALPSLDAYQLFYGPYAFYDTYNGFNVGAWLMGRQ